ncbi:MAG: elongation factor 1-beta [Candidatus Pacearchaeota archaeon]|nr:MAG: elongation factor 1-beta [Candidatus Pacearchaeota archaeon]
MAIIVKIKIMPKTIETNFESLKNKLKNILSEAENINYEVEPIAFGLKALIVTFLYPEDKDLEPLEIKIQNMEEVNSVEILDIRRALG